MQLLPALQRSQKELKNREFSSRKLPRELSLYMGPFTLPWGKKTADEADDAGRLRFPLSAEIC